MSDDELTDAQVAAAAASPPTVSVIIPVYNCEAFLEDTLASVFAQTFKDFEVIVVDDGSTDSTPQILERHRATLRVVRTSNGGVCRARNLGIRLARGEFVCLLDHDDYWYPEKLASQVRALRSHPEVAVVFSEFINWLPTAGKFPPPSSFQPEDVPEEIEPEFSGWIYHQFLIDCWMLTSTAMFRRSVFEECGTFDEALPYSEDWELWIRISRRHQFLKFRRPTTLYRQHPRQGNRVVRPVDHRTQLLEASVRRWGLCSPDGRCVQRSAYLRQLSRYHFEYGLMHVAANNRSRALISLWRAFTANPLAVKVPLYMLAAAIGWKPKWSQV